MTWIPRVKLWNSGATSLLYTFPAVQNHNAPHTSKKFIKQSNFRSQGEIIIEGGEEPWELVISFVITADGYENIVSAIETLESTIELNIPYIIRIDTSSTTYFNQTNGGYKVKRTKPIEYLNREEDLMNDMQRAIIRFDANSW